MQAPSISSGHLKALSTRYPYAYYIWNAGLKRFELWCDEGRGHPPYKFMTLQGPSGEYREPGEWVINELRRSDPDTGEFRTQTRSGRKDWIRSLRDERGLAKEVMGRHGTTLERLRDEARFLKRHGRVFGLSDSLHRHRGTLARKSRGRMYVT